MSKKLPDFSKVEKVTEANLKVSPYSIFELDEEEIEFTSELKYDFSKVSLIDNDYHGKTNPIDHFTV
ncbi:hypothetical protein [Aeribacillus alveayuensis]|uniref:Uncharacterized protein n=1 Tax=Aeribacillus alveayuensis TaxID=279215 RepID=A0ABT9VM24_9BACI|nr:hypothetical protein [Bacillus alveayuensis]